MVATPTRRRITHYVPFTQSPLFAAGVESLLGTPEGAPYVTWATHAIDVLSVEQITAQVENEVMVIVDLTAPFTLIDELATVATAKNVTLVGIAHAPQPVRLLAAAQAGFDVVALSTDSRESLLEALSVAQSGDIPSLSQGVARVLEEHPAVVLPARVAETVRVLDEGITRAETAGRLQPPVSSCTVSTYVERAFNLYSASGRPVSSIVGLLREARIDGYLPCVASELQCRSV